MKAGTFFHEFFARSIKILSGGDLTFEGQTPLTGIADKNTSVISEDKIVTPKYVDDNFLSSQLPDTAKGLITFEDGLYCKGAAIAG